MRAYIIMGLFAFLVAIISLLRIMAEREFFRLTLMKRIWGRRRGLALHFLSSVALPLIAGIVFFTGGISGIDLVDPLIVEKPFGSVPVADSIENNLQNDQFTETFFNLAA